MTDLNIIVAITKNNAIGRGGDLVYHLKGDMRHFREITMGHTVVMGRKTWESLPKGALPGRRNIVVSRNPKYEAAGAEVYPTLSEALERAGNSKIFLIGGAQIYAQSLPMANRLYLTQIDADVDDADTFFPEINRDEWTEEVVDQYVVDEITGVKYRFVCLSRK